MKMQNEIKNVEFIKEVSNLDEPLVQMGKIRNNQSWFGCYDLKDSLLFYTIIKGSNSDEVFARKCEFLNKLDSCNNNIVYIDERPIKQVLDNVTSIRVHESTKESLNSLKLSDRESHEAIIRRLIMYYKERNHEF